MRALNTRERWLARATVGIVLVAGYWGLVLEPQLRKGEALAKEVRDLKTALTRMQGNLLLRDRIEQRYQQIHTALEHAGSTEQEIARFAQRLERLYSPLRLQVTGVRALPVENEGHYRRLAVRLELQGSVRQVAALLAAIASASEPVRAERVELTCRERPGDVTAVMHITQLIAPSGTANESQRTGEVEGTS